MPPRQLSLIKSILKKHGTKTYFCLGFGAGGTIAHISIYVVSKYVDVIPTPHLHPLLSVAIWWIGAAIVVPFLPYRDQHDRQEPTIMHLMTECADLHQMDTDTAPRKMGQGLRHWSLTPKKVK